MKQLNKREHATALFVLALHHWYVGDQLSADACITFALQVASSMSHGNS